MESLFKVVVFLVFMFFVVIGASALFGYSCTSCNSVDDFSNTPCIPVLSNGKANPHYKNSWYACKRSCISEGKRSTKLDVKTCDCYCE